MRQNYLHVFVNAFWNEGSGMTGGDKRVIEILKKWKQKENLHFSIIVYAPQKFVDLLENENIDNIEIRCTAPNGSEKRGIYVSYIYRTFKALKAIPHRDGDSHCFYSTSDYFPDVIPCIVGKVINRQASWIALVHHIYEHYKTRPGNKKINFISYYLQQFSLFLMKIKSDKVLLVSPLVYNYLVSKRGFHKSRLKRVDNGIDTTFIDSAVPYDEVGKQYDAIMLARLAPSKGIYDLPAIWEKVLKKNPEARLGIIGGGTEEIKRELLKRCEHHGVKGSVDLLGFLDSESACRYLKSAKVFIFTSREEGWGISVAEAMACGLPVIAFSLPIYKYIFPKGIKSIENRDVGEMAGQIDFFLKSIEERKKLGNAGQQFVREHYEWTKIADNEIIIIEKIMEGKRCKRT